MENELLGNNKKFKKLNDNKLKTSMRYSKVFEKEEINQVKGEE